MRKFQLTIPEPCHENWDAMTAVDKGKFCGSCQKGVTDFTGMSDQQLIAFFKKPSTGSVCGRFNHNQLNYDFETPRKRIPWLKYFFTIAVPAFLASNKVHAQGQVKKVVKKETVAAKCDQVMGLSRVIVGDVAVKIIEPDSITISGKVVDEKGNGIPYASLLIESFLVNASADLNGNFNIKFPGRLEDEVILNVSSFAYISGQLVINKNNFTEKKKIELKLKPALVLRELNPEPEICTFSVGAVSIKREKKFLSFFKATKKADREDQKQTKEFGLLETSVKDTAFKNFKFYPNPATPGFPITIQWKKQEASEFEIQLLNQSGQIINSKTENFVEKTNAVQYMIPMVAAGNYFLVMKNRKSQKRITEKIIIQ